MGLHGHQLRTFRFSFCSEKEEKGGLGARLRDAVKLITAAEKEPVPSQGLTWEKAARG